MWTLFHFDILKCFNFENELFLFNQWFRNFVVASGGLKICGKEMWKVFVFVYNTICIWMCCLLDIVQSKLTQPRWRDVKPLTARESPIFPETHTAEQSGVSGCSCNCFATRGRKCFIFIGRWSAFLHRLSDKQMLLVSETFPQTKRMPEIFLTILKETTCDWNNNKIFWERQK